VWQTARRSNEPGDGELAFRGRISHVEILIKHRAAHRKNSEGDWYRYSIMKLLGTRSPDNVVTWKPGVVHAIKTASVDGDLQVKNYRFFRVDLGLEGVNRALEFLQRQVHERAGFNNLGYLLNFASPALFGLCHYKHAERRRKNTWFCTELIVCALQAGGMDTFALRKACAISPNELFDIIAGVEGEWIFSGNYIR
jgi:hypothetical protein